MIWTIFDKTEKVMTDDARRSLSNWLKNVKPEEGSQAWVHIFAGILNRVFGAEYLSWKTFGRSCVASIIALTLMLFIYFLKAKSPFQHLSATPTLVLVWIPATFFVDYVSLCGSRGAISEMGKVGTGGVILLLLGDFILTTIIFVAGASFVLMSLQGTGNAKEIAFLVDPTLVERYKDSPNGPRTKEQVEEMIEKQVESLIIPSQEVLHAVDLIFKGFPFWRAESTAPLFGIFFCSTFITSVWVWLYALGGLVIKAIQYLGFGTAKLRRWLDIENQPMLAIGYICMLLVTLSFVFILIF